jgi:HSP20 family protein
MGNQQERSGGPVTRTNEAGQQIQKVTPARDLSPFEEMDRVLNRFFHSGWSWPWRREFPAWGELAASFEGMLPRVDVIEHDSEIVVKAEVPGVNKEDLNVSVTDNTLTIKGNTRREQKEEKGDYYRREISRGSFARTVALPGNVDSAEVKATFNNGIPEVVMPKIEKSKRRTVTIE